jgi:hypothetical protein
MRIKILSFPNNFRQGRCRNRASDKPYQYSGFVAGDALCSRCPHPRRQKSIEYSRRTASLYVSQFHNPQFKAKPLAVLLEVARERFGVVASSFGNHNDGVGFPALVRFT